MKVMKLRDIVHPEVVLGIRGRANDIEIYKSAKEWVKVVNGMVAVRDDAMKLFGRDENLLEHFILCEKFSSHPTARLENVFYVPKEFLKALSRIDREIPVDIIKDDFIGYLQFADSVISDDTGPVEGAYVFVGRGKEIGIRDKNGVEDKKVLAISYLNKHTGQHKGFWVVNRLSCELTPSKVDDLVSSVKAEDRSLAKGITIPVSEEAQEARKKVFRAVINALVYIHSADPSILGLLPADRLTSSQRQQSRFNNGLENQTGISLRILNLRYGTEIERHYNVDSTVVQTHMRWQRVGPQLSQVKLIWVKEHERHYDNKIEKISGESESCVASI